MLQLNFLALSFMALRLSSAAPLSVTTSSNNLIAGILAGLKDSDAPSPTTNIVAATNSGNVINSLEYLTPTSGTAEIVNSLENLISASDSADSVTPLGNLKPATTSLGLSGSSRTGADATETGDLGAILALISDSSSETGVAVAPLSITTTAGSLSGSQSEIINLVLKVFKFLALSLGASSSIVNSIDSVADSLDGSSSGVNVESSFSTIAAATTTSPPTAWTYAAATATPIATTSADVLSFI